MLIKVQLSDETTKTYRLLFSSASIASVLHCSNALLPADFADFMLDNNFALRELSSRREDICSLQSANAAFIRLNSSFETASSKSTVQNKN